MKATAVRLLQVGDLDAYKALRIEVMSSHESAFTSDAAAEVLREPSSYASRLASETTRTFTLGAFAESRLVGAATCEHDARVKVQHIGHIIGMMVSAKCQGQGVGGALLDALIERARADQRLRQLTLTVTAGNAAAERLYQGRGFVRCGTHPRAICVDRTDFDKHLMFLALDR
jgi:ribosomal protein S18 acetylase RimI-like enzyme